MIKNILWLVVCLLSFCTLPAQDQASVSQPTNTQNDTLENALLWEISGNGLKTPSYLYGTIHIIGEDDFFLTDSTVITFNQTKQLALEIDIDDMNNPFKMLGMIGGMMMDDGLTLKDLLKEDEYKITHQYIIDSMGMPSLMAGMMERMKPMFLSEMVGTDMSSMQEGDGMLSQQGSKSYEMELSAMAKEKEMEVLGLETVAFQLSIFDSIPYKEQAYMLYDAIQSGGEKEAAALDELVEMYKKQDINGLNQMIVGDAEFSKYNEILLVNRNKNWIPKIGKYAQQMPTFFAVGAGHLPGDQGVIMLLRQAGYTVRAIH